MEVTYINSIGKKKLCSNCRGIRVMVSVGILYGRVLKQSIERESNDVEEQSCFKSGRCCVEATCIWLL